MVAQAVEDLLSPSQSGPWKGNAGVVHRIHSHSWSMPSTTEVHGLRSGAPWPVGHESRLLAGSWTGPSLGSSAALGINWNLKAGGRTSETPGDWSADFSIAADFPVAFFYHCLLFFFSPCLFSSLFYLLLFPFLPLPWFLCLFFLISMSLHRIAKELHFFDVCYSLKSQGLFLLSWTFSSWFPSPKWGFHVSGTFPCLSEWPSDPLVQRLLTPL